MGVGEIAVVVAAYVVVLAIVARVAVVQTVVAEIVAAVAFDFVDTNASDIVVVDDKIHH